MAKRDSNLIWYLLALGGAIAAFGYTKKEALVLYGSKVFEAGGDLLFKLSLPSRAQPYSDMILMVAKETGVDPYIIFAIGDRESNWGQTLRSGTGDWTVRGMGWAKTPASQVVYQLPSGWSAGQVSGPPYVIPADGLGWGRGLMQLDLQESLSVDWTDPLSNIRAGAKLYQDGVRFFSGNSPIPGYTDGSVVMIDASAKRLGVEPGGYPDPRPLEGELLAQTAAAAYNTGDANALMALAAGVGQDATTTGADYSADVWRRLQSALAILG
jgi:hypothetical protein